ncbi:MAG: HEAT repeat domain-containing protein [Planctomycetota bacterium]|nr:HEAT repeat domain-containing protein [Planctomycetota bacterium]
MPRHLAWSLLGLLLAACTQGAGGDPAPDVSPRSFRDGTPATQAAIDEVLVALPGTRGAERLQLAERLMGYGEPVLPRLIELLEHEDEDMRLLAAWLLGRWKDPRTLDALDRAQADRHEGVRFEAATALVRAGDARGMRTLVDGLVHSDPRIRSRSINVLEQVTGERFGYRADDHPHERRAAVARWTSWLEARAVAPPSDEAEDASPRG